ncbi:MAG: hypothetical protein ACI9FU_001134 [Granulosicoccus sp.]|jgi:uncharacterized protein involved in exopolysaccharide biosynthesis
MSEQPLQQEDPLKQLILLVQGFYRETLSRSIFIGIFGIVFAAIGVATAILLPIEYEAKLTFLIEEPGGSASALAGYAGVASQFGIDLGGESSAFSTDNVVELLRSRQLVTEALLSQEDDGTPLINRFINAYALREEWNEDPRLEQISFGKEQGYLQDSLLAGIYLMLVEDHLVIERVNVTSNILYVSCVTREEQFSKKMTESLVSAVTKYYVDVKTQRTRQTLDFVQERTDSVAGALSAAELEFARWKDSQRSITKAEGYLTELRLQRQVQILNAMYAEAIKNLELSKVTLLKETPLMQVIDRPILPLTQIKLSLARALLIFGFIGGLLAIIWVIGGKIVRDALQN